MNRARSPNNDTSFDSEETERQNASPTFIRGLGTALKKLDTLKEMKNQRDIAEKEGKGQEVKNDAAPFSPKGMIYLPNGNRNP